MARIVQVSSSHQTKSSHGLQVLWTKECHIKGSGSFNVLVPVVFESAEISVGSVLTDTAELCTV